ncbi:unnamed protein product [Vitrella brassicaformis CCMP3155]|uniref:Uncharacterized protein n=1 Tax=Vitrella brassicaformis (strain CCMP3155) TaxID=1169540 RepID=A0A0G4EJ19_VITBC|nr:unnamed protein product [Vitrella brassicaformis CCMP3155]|eukprot:CEL96069.1 unnamed protein product [Vitrella brassicaformis CCMP3155]
MEVRPDLPPLPARGWQRTLSSGIADHNGSAGAALKDANIVVPTGPSVTRKVVVRRPAYRSFDDTAAVETSPERREWVQKGERENLSGGDGASKVGHAAATQVGESLDRIVFIHPDKPPVIYSHIAPEDRYPTTSPLASLVPSRAADTSATHMQSQYTSKPKPPTRPVVKVEPGRLAKRHDPVAMGARYRQEWQNLPRVVTGRARPRPATDVSRRLGFDDTHRG